MWIFIDLFVRIGCLMNLSIIKLILFFIYKIDIFFLCKVIFNGWNKKINKLYIG